MDAPVSGKLSVYLRPLLIDGPELIVSELNLSAVDLAGVDVDVNVGMLGIPVNGGECHRLGKGLFQKFVGQLSDLGIRGRHVEGQDNPVMGPASFGLLKFFP